MLRWPSYKAVARSASVLLKVICSSELQVMFLCRVYFCVFCICFMHFAALFCEQFTLLPGMGTALLTTLNRKWALSFLFSIQSSDYSATAVAKE